MTEKIHIICRFHEELLSAGDRAVAEEILVPDVVHHGHQPLRDRDSVLGALTDELRTAFPDVTSSVDDVFGNETKMVARYTVRGTHQGDFGEVAATGNQVEVGAMSIYHFSGERITEIWTETDGQDLMQQLEEE